MVYKSCKIILPNVLPLLRQGTSYIIKGRGVFYLSELERELCKFSSENLGEYILSYTKSCICCSGKGIFYG